MDEASNHIIAIRPETPHVDDKVVRKLINVLTRQLQNKVTKKIKSIIRSRESESAQQRSEIVLEQGYAERY